MFGKMNRHSCDSPYPDKMILSARDSLAYSITTRSNSNCMKSVRSKCGLGYSFRSGDQPVPHNNNWQEDALAYRYPLPFENSQDISQQNISRFKCDHGNKRNPDRCQRESDNGRRDSDYIEINSDHSRRDSGNGQTESCYGRRDSDYIEINSDHSRRDSGNGQTESGYGRRDSDYIEINSDCSRRDSDNSKKEPGYNRRDSDYVEINSDSGRRNSDYSKNESGYGRKQPDFIEINSDSERRNSDYSKKEPGFGRRDSDYSKIDSGYGRKDSDYSKKEPGYDRREPDYIEINSDCSRRDSDYSQKEPDFGRRDPDCGRRGSSNIQTEPGYDRIERDSDNGEINTDNRRKDSDYSSRNSDCICINICSDRRDSDSDRRSPDYNSAGVISDDNSPGVHYDGNVVDIESDSSRRDSLIIPQFLYQPDKSPRPSPNYKTFGKMTVHVSDANKRNVIKHTNTEGSFQVSGGNAHRSLDNCYERDGSHRKPSSNNINKNPNLSSQPQRRETYSIKRTHKESTQGIIPENYGPSTAKQSNISDYRGLVCDFCSFVPAPSLNQEEAKAAMKMHFKSVRHNSASLANIRCIRDQRKAVSVITECFLINKDKHVALINNVVPMCPQCFTVHGSIWACAKHNQVIHNSARHDQYGLGKVRLHRTLLFSADNGCRQCNKPFKTASELHKHWRVTQHLRGYIPDGNQRALYFCPYCTTTCLFFEFAGCRMHIIQKHKKSGDAVMDIVFIEPPTNYLTLLPVEQRPVYVQAKKEIDLVKSMSRNSKHTGMSKNAKRRLRREKRKLQELQKV